VVTAYPDPPFQYFLIGFVSISQVTMVGARRTTPCMASYAPADSARIFWANRFCFQFVYLFFSVNDSVR